jgi:hypothetical protein
MCLGLLSDRAVFVNEVCVMHCRDPGLSLSGRLPVTIPLSYPAVVETEGPVKPQWSLC